MGVSAEGQADAAVKDVNSVAKLQRHDTAASEMTDVESQVRTRLVCLPVHTIHNTAVVCR